MKQTTNKLNTAFSSFFRNRLNAFYVLAFIPLLLIVCYHVKWPFGVVIPIYGFILLLIKKRNLSLCHEAGNIQRILGLLVVLGSFFVYYALVPFFPSRGFYGSANYAVYVFGLFLTFYDISALKEAFTPIFLIVAATSSSFISNWLKPFLLPFANDFAHIILSILRALGINAKIYNSGNTPLLIYPSLSGIMVGGTFVYECIGVSSMLIFSIILVVILFEDPSRLKVKLAYAIAGVLGTFVLNIFRVTLIFLADYFYGAEVGGTVHYVIGYTLFSAWLAIFFYTFSKRQVISGKFKLIWKKLRS